MGLHLVQSASVCDDSHLSHNAVIEAGPMLKTWSADVCADPCLAQNFIAKVGPMLVSEHEYV